VLSNGFEQITPLLRSPNSLSTLVADLLWNVFLLSYCM